MSRADAQDAGAKLQQLQRFRCSVSANWLRCFLSASHLTVSAFACWASAASGGSAIFGFTDPNDPIGDGMWRHPDDPGWVSMGSVFDFSGIALYREPNATVSPLRPIGYLLNGYVDRRFRQRPGNASCAEPATAQ